MEGIFIHDALGRMTSKQAVTAVNGVAQVSAVFSQPVFDASKVHAVSSAQSMSDLFPTGAQNVTYTCFDKVSQIMQGSKTLNYTYGYDHQRIFMEEHVGTNVRTKRYVGNCEYVTETSGNTTASRWLTYLSGPTGVYAVVVTENNVNTVHYILKDNLGSWTTITNSSGTVEQQLSYDAWGNLRNPSTWTGDFTGTPMFDRGYTGHEHLYNFGLINMICRFFSPDPFVQAPDFTQNYNRYSYCLNNPVMYSDPDGKLVGTVLGFISDLFSNLFVKPFTGEDDDWDQTKLGWEIDLGLFHTDPNKSFLGQVWEIVSRFTWQAPQTSTGHLLVSGANLFEQVNGVTYGFGMTAVDMGSPFGAVTIGNYSGGPNGYKADWRDHLFVHEYGHYIQSQQYGPLYFPFVAIPSFQSASIKPNEHRDHWFEADASYKGADYFDKYFGSGKEGYVVGSPNYFDKHSFSTDNDSPYPNPRKANYNKTVYPISGSFHWADISYTIAPFVYFLFCSLSL